jgi:hypothetical protein
MTERETAGVTERETAQRALAEYKRWAAAHPDAPGIDASDLAAIGAARSKPGITRAQVADLVRTAQAHGRTWPEIADRLAMTPAQARRTYGTKARPKPESRREQESKSPQTVISAVLDALADALRHGARALNNAASMAREHSRH